MRIKHKEWGIGTILYELSGGYQLLVNFDDHGKIQVLQKDCEKIPEVKVEKVPEVKVEKVPEVKVEKVPEVKVEKVPEVKVENSDILANKKIIEAFRLGIVPGFAIQDITVGREKEIKKVEKWLSKDSESLMMIGQYGQGKSHIIRYIRQKALDEGYLVAYCDIGEESLMHKPKSVFNTLMKSLVFKDKENGVNYNNNLKKFLKLYAKFVSKFSKEGSQNMSKFLKPGIGNLIRRINNKWTEEELDSNYLAGFVDYLCGDEDTANPYRFKKSSIPPFQTSASIICNILSSIGNMAASMNNSENSFKGLILIFDEGEAIDSPGYNSKQRDGGINLVNGLTEISNNNDDLLSESHNLTNKYGQYYGEQTKLVYSGIHKDVRFSNHKENHVKCLFTFVEGETEVIDTLEEYGVEKIILIDFTSIEKNKLIYKIIEIYEKAYEYKVKHIEKLRNILIKRLENSDNTRSIIKITVEAIELSKEWENHNDELDESDYEKILR